MEQKQEEEDDADKESENWIYLKLRLVCAARFLHSWLMVIPQIGGKHRLIGHKKQEQKSDTHPDKSADYDPFACICKIA